MEICEYCWFVPHIAVTGTILDKTPVNSLLSEGLFPSIEHKKYVKPVFP